MKKALFSIILIAIIGVVVLKTISPVNAAPFSMTVDSTTKQHILKSTVMIGMFEYDNSGGRGLGTVVRHNGQTVIITHDHWSHLNPNLYEVEFSNAQGQLLVILNAAEFQRLILYRDGGTMVLSLPSGLNGFVPTALAGPGTVSAGDELWMARRVPTGTRDTVEIIGAVVDEVATGSGTAYLKMRGSGNAAVIPGDSGGGVWVNGLLVANVWSAGVTVTQSWYDELVGSDAVNETNSINAALSPLEGAVEGAAIEGPAVSNLEGKLLR